ncbi:MAG: helicase RepA family protein [Actinomycetota bacterium]|nr:helicase RepA family protein [Actinomycetota bacterium]
MTAPSAERRLLLLALNDPSVLAAVNADDFADHDLAVVLRAARDVLESDRPYDLPSIAIALAQRGRGELSNLVLDAVGAAPDPTPHVNGRRTSFTLSELLGMTFPEPRWAVRGILAEGVNLLAGAPKTGKSWMGLNLAVAVASGGKAFGRIDVDGGDVLYLALEDSPRRLHERFTTLGAQPSDRLTISTECEPLEQGGDQRIEHWLRQHDGARLVVIDVFARVRGFTPERDRYNADYLAITPIKTLADRHSVPFLVLHHTRKQGADDFLDTVSGTQGLAGAADAVLVLQRSRGRADAELHLTGRDVEEARYALRWDPLVGTWTMLEGDADEWALRETRATILRHLRHHGGALPPKTISDDLVLPYETVKKTCKRMADDGQLLNDGTGGYSAPVSPVPPVPGVPEQTSPGTPGTGDSGDRRDTSEKERERLEHAPLDELLAELDEDRP